MSRRVRTVFVLFVGLACSVGVSASETTTYKYDARGRLVRVVRDNAGTIQDTQACYKYDKADNRTKVKVDVSVNPASPPACPP